MMLLTFDCSGCFVTVEKIRLGARDTVQSVTPEGWVAFDPYTHCTYCPKCWAEIELAPQAQGDVLTEEDITRAWAALND